MKKAIVFEAARTGYSIDQVDRPMTVGKLKSILEDFDEDDLFILSHDNGYTYGSIDCDDLAEWEEIEEDEDGECWRPCY